MLRQTMIRNFACRTKSVRLCMPRYSSNLAPTSRTPILWHHFDKPVPYQDGLRLQEALVERRSHSKSIVANLDKEQRSLSDSEIQKHKAIAEQDVILLLEHTPVYTTGRRETDEEILKIERERLTAIGAEYIATQRGGQTTYHGPGQLVGYPIIDTSLMDLSTRCYVQRISDFLERLLIDRLEIPLLLPSPQVGAYPSSTSKVGSIGIQIRHRITSHGFALNVTDDVKFWFDQIIACGSPDIKATSIESELRRLDKAPVPRLEVGDIVPLAVSVLGQVFKREMRSLDNSPGHAELAGLMRRFGRET